MSCRCARRCSRFNPRPREGGDPATPRDHSSTILSFNPRPREGGDSVLGRRQRDRLVSIHAPVKGATGGWRPPAGWGRSFNPRPREGGDRVCELPSAIATCFNPRPREGGDFFRPLPPIIHDIVSIHAPVKGATWLGYCDGGGRFVSIHAPVKGATFLCRYDSRCLDVSIHAPVKGATAAYPTVTLSINKGQLVANPRDICQQLTRLIIHSSRNCSPSLKLAILRIQEHRAVRLWFAKAKLIAGPQDHK